MCGKASDQATSHTDAAANKRSKDLSWDKFESEKLEFQFTVVFNIALNEDLERHYCLLDTLCKVSIAVFGTYSFASLFIQTGRFYKACSLLIAVVSIVMLVVDFAEKRVKAKNQRNRYSKILTEAKSAKCDDDLDRVRRDADEISCDDLPTGEICDALALNIAIDRMGRDPTYKAEVGWFKRVTRHCWPWGRPKYGHG